MVWEVGFLLGGVVVLGYVVLRVIEVLWVDLDGYCMVVLLMTELVRSLMRKGGRRRTVPLALAPLKIS